MYQTQTHRCDDRIISISQPYVQPMVRGKQDKPVEFGAKLSVSLTGEGLAHADHLRWDAFHEGLDLATQVEAYRERYDLYPERVLTDPICGARTNRDYLKQRGIQFAGKPLGRPQQVTDANRADTSFAWINTIFLVMNLLILERSFLVLSKCRLAGLLKAVTPVWEQLVLIPRTQLHLAIRFGLVYG